MLTKVKSQFFMHFFLQHKFLVIFVGMNDQELHIELLSKIATAGQNNIRLPGALIKVNAKDSIEAGRRLEELNYFNFKNDDAIERSKLILRIRDSIIDKYYRFLRLKENILIFEGGSRSGKTNNICRDIVLDCENNGAIWNIIAPSFKMLNLGSFIDIKDFVDEQSLDVKMPASASGQIKFKSGGLITFEVVTSENEAKRNRKNVYINESDGIKKEIASLIIGRASGRILIDFNPTRKFWVEDYKKPDNVNVLRTMWYDNPFLSANQLEWFANLKKHGENAPIGSPERYVYEVYYLGNYSSLAKSVFRADDFEFWDSLPSDFDTVFSYADPSLGVGNDYFAAGLFGIKNGQDYLIDSIFSQYETAETYLKTMKRWDKMYSCEHFVETNGLGKLIFNKIKNNYSGMLCSVSNQDNKQGDIILYSPEAKQILFNKSQTTTEMIKQCVAFPDAEHDDAPDMICRSRKIKEKYFTI